MGTELVDQERVFTMHDGLDRATGELFVKRGSYGKRGMIVLGVKTLGTFNQIYLQEKQVIALIQSLTAAFDYSTEGHTPCPIAWPETQTYEEEY